MPDFRLSVQGSSLKADLDLVLGNDITSPVAIHEMDKMKVDGVLTRTRSRSCWIISCRIRTLSLRSTANVSVNLPAAMTLRIILMWERWESSTRCFRRKDSRWRRCHHRSGFTYLYLRGARRIFHRRRQHGYGCRYGNRKSVV